MSIAGKVVAVTGASSGIGLATAELLASEGAVVHALARRQPLGSFNGHPVDVTDPGAVQRSIGGIAAAAGLDALVLCAGRQIPRRRLEQLTPESWRLLVSANLDGVFYCVHAALPHLRRSRGQVVLVSSVSALWPDESGPAYQAAKAGAVALARASGLEEHQHGVRFSTILPGVVDTPMLDERPQSVPAEIRARALRPSDVAHVCLFLLSLRPDVYIPELTVLPTPLQRLGGTVLPTEIYEVHDEDR